MNEFFHFFQLTVIVSAAMMLLAKSVHYAMAIRRKSLFNWFYFNFYSIVNSQNDESERAKRLQNKFTMSIILLVVLVAASFALNRFLETNLPLLFS